MAQATWRSHSRGVRLTHGLLRGFRPPSEETAFLIAFSAVVLAVVILHARGAVKPRAEAFPGVADTTIAAPAPALPGVPLVQPVVPPPPVTLPLAERPAVPPPAPQSTLLTQPAVPMSVRSVDLKTLPALNNLTTQTGTSFDPQRVTYGQLSGAGEIALVSLQADGTAGTLAVAVVGIGKDGPQVLTLLTPDKTSRSRLNVTLDNGAVVMIQGVLGPEDPLCCPSQTKRSYYAWDGSRLQLQREVTSQNIGAKN